MKKIYGYVYTITNIVNNRVYVGQAKNGFKKRYGGLTIHNIYKRTRSKKLKIDIEKYNEDKYWLINTEYDVAYSKEELNIKEYEAFLKYLWENMPLRKRSGLNDWDNGDSNDTWFQRISHKGDLPDVFYNVLKPPANKTKHYNSNTKVIYSKLRIKNNINLPRIKNYSRCWKKVYPIPAYYKNRSQVLYTDMVPGSDTILYTDKVRYTGYRWIKRRIYIP